MNILLINQVAMQRQVLFNIRRINKRVKKEQNKNVLPATDSTAVVDVSVCIGVRCALCLCVSGARIQKNDSGFRGYNIILSVSVKNVKLSVMSDWPREGKAHSRA